MELLRRSSFIITRQLSRQFSDTMPQGFSEDGQEKGKKKKWWGDLFKRRNRKASDSSSDEDEDDGKRRGFLRRKKHDRGSKDVTNSFVINPGIKQQDRGRSLESVQSSDRTVDRTSDRSSVSKRRIKAKVEASREQLKDSSSDEGSSYTSSLPSGGSFPRRSRVARTERHNRRQLWSASVVYQESNDYDTKFRAKARSATPSPAASPKVKPRAASQDSVAPPPPPRRMEIPKYQPPVYNQPPSVPRYKPRYNGLPHHSSDPAIPKDWNEPEVKMPEEKKPPAPPRRVPSTEERKRQAHLEEALCELEAIYKKLEDLQDAPSERSGEPCAEDDMAYRKLNKRETSCQDSREILSQAGSYLLVSPTLSPGSNVPSSPNGIEPDVTYDDVVYRTINHSNNTLKCLDPQPLFGIPLGPISPAPSSDYLHAQPNQYELKPPDEPDIVTDDLAFRNLRKDNQELRKKKAVRSLSANLSNVIFRNNNNVSALNNNNLDNKSQSYSDIPEEMRLAQRVLDMRRAKKPEVKNALPQLPRVNKEEMRRKFFAGIYDDPSETDLLKELEDEARATSLEIEQQLSKQKPDALYSRSMTDLLEELTKNLDYDFGQATTNAPCQTCGDNDTSKISRGSSSFHSHASPPMKSKTVARAASHHAKPDSPKARNKLQNAKSAPQAPTNIKDRPRFPLPHEQKENMQEENKSFTPYRSPSNSIRILRDACENLPKTRKKVESPRHWESSKSEEHSRNPTPRNPSPRSSNTPEELFNNLAYQPESPRYREKSPRAEQRSASLKIQSECPRPWESNFKGRSDSYHGPMQMRSSTPKPVEVSPNTRRRLSNASPKRMECSPNNSFRRRTPSPGRHQFRESPSQSQWEKSLDELCKFQEPFFSPVQHVQQVQQIHQKRESSPRPWLSRQSPIEREISIKEPYRLSPQPMKSHSPKPWMNFLNGNDGHPLQRDHMHNLISARKEAREGARSPKPWPMPLSVGRSLDEGSYLASERMSPKPRWSSVREKVVNDQFHEQYPIRQEMLQYQKPPQNWPAYQNNEMCKIHDYLQRSSPKRLSQETLQVPEFNIHRPVINPEPHQYNRESPKRMMELPIQRAPEGCFVQSCQRESPHLVEHPLQRNLSNEILSYGCPRESPSQLIFEMRRHSNDEGYHRASPRQMLSEYGQRVVNPQLLNQASYKRETPSPRSMEERNQMVHRPPWGSMEEKGSPPLKVKPSPWRHSISGPDRVDISRNSPQLRRSPVRIQRSPVRDEPKLVKNESARTWEDLNSFYNKLSEKKKGSPSWESLDGQVKSSPELKINELTVYPDPERPKTPESPRRRRSSSPKDLSPSRKEFGNQLGVIGENRVVRRESQSRIECPSGMDSQCPSRMESPVRLYRSSSSREDDFRRSPPVRDSFVDRVFPPDDCRQFGRPYDQQQFDRQQFDQQQFSRPFGRQPLLNSSPIDVAAMEAESEEEKDLRSGQGVSQLPATSVGTKEPVQKL